LGDGITFHGEPAPTLPGSEAAADAIAESTAFASVREFLLLQREAPERSLFARIIGLDPLAREAAGPYAGALAEITVAESLERLGSDWIVLNDLSIGSKWRPISYALVGPPGVFTLEVHNHSNADVWVGERSIVVDGAPHTHIEESERRADRVARRLSEATDSPVAVTPCLVVANAAELTVRERPRRVEVLVPNAVGPFFAELPRLLSPEAVDRHRDAALAPTTWRTGSRATARNAGGLVDRAEFAAIHRSIVESHRRRLFWAISGAALSSVMLLATTGDLIARTLGLIR
jgi:hypothetical protein